MIKSRAPLVDLRYSLTREDRRREKPEITAELGLLHDNVFAIL